MDGKGSTMPLTVVCGTTEHEVAGVSLLGDLEARGWNPTTGMQSCIDGGKAMNACEP